MWKSPENDAMPYTSKVYERPTQTAVEWSWHVISIAACNIIVTSPGLSDNKTVAQRVSLRRTSSNQIDNFRALQMELRRNT